MIKLRSAAAVFSAAFILSTASASAESEALLSHDSGFYDKVQLVTVSGGDDVDVYFTTDGSKPDTESELYDGRPIVVKQNTVIRTAAYSGDVVVDRDKATIKIRTNTPKASVKGGEYSEAQTVELSCTEKNAKIYYTTDGTSPTSKSKKYTKPLTVSESTTLKFAAIAPDKSRSTIITEEYIINEDDFEDELCQILFELVNETRAEYGLSPLKAHDVLTEAAQIRAKEYSVNLSHWRPDGTKWDSLLSEYGLRRDIRAENLAYYYETAKGALKCWMSDYYHKKNILNPNAEYIGLGRYNNGYCNYWCQLFIGGE